MGLMVDTTYGVPVVHHGGDMIGFHSDMMWLPEHSVGAVILTNGDPGWLIRSGFRRKLLEVLFDGRPEADADLARQAKTFFEQLAAERKLLTVPAEPALDAAKLARALHERRARRDRGAADRARRRSSTSANGRARSRRARNPDGTMSFITIAPGVSGFEFVVSTAPTRGLILRDAQHEYRFEAR